MEDELIGVRVKEGVRERHSDRGDLTKPTNQFKTGVDLGASVDAETASRGKGREVGSSAGDTVLGLGTSAGRTGLVTVRAEGRACSWNARVSLFEARGTHPTL